MHRNVDIFMVLDVGGRGAAGRSIIRNALDCYHIHGFVSAREGGCCLQNQGKCMAVLYSVIIFMVLGVSRRGAAGVIIIRIS